MCACECLCVFGVTWGHKQPYCSPILKNVLFFSTCKKIYVKGINK